MSGYEKVISWFSWLVAGVLLFFTVRRWLFTVVALMPDKPPLQPSAGVQQSTGSTDVLILVPVRNEAQALPDLLIALDQLIYPKHKLTLVFVNDGSTDSSNIILQSWTATRANWHLLTLAQNVGKANALNAAMAMFGYGEIIVIFDADERPYPAALQYLVQPFANKRVGGVSGRRATSNQLVSPAASYTAFEGLVHQLITMRAKDKLNLAPALLGANCAYRRTALAHAGNFKPGVLLEDSDLTLKLARAGWKVHFEPAAISYHRVPETVAGYWKQHRRWARGFNEVAKDQGRSLLFDRQLPLFLRLELLIFSLGYLDRLALLAGAGLALTGNRRAGWAVRLSLMTPLLQVIAALKIAHAPPAMWLRVVWLPLFFMIDMAMAITGLWDTLRQTPQVWEERLARR